MRCFRRSQCTSDKLARCASGPSWNLLSIQNHTIPERNLSHGHFDSIAFTIKNIKEEDLRVYYNIHCGKLSSLFRTSNYVPLNDQEQSFSHSYASCVSAVPVLSSARNIYSSALFSSDPSSPLQYQGLRQLRPYCWQSTSCTISKPGFIN